MGLCWSGQFLGLSQWAFSCTSHSMCALALLPVSSACLVAHSWQLEPVSQGGSTPGDPIVSWGHEEGMEGIVRLHNQEAGAARTSESCQVESAAANWWVLLYYKWQLPRCGKLCSSSSSIYWQVYIHWQTWTGWQIMWIRKGQLASAALDAKGYNVKQRNLQQTTNNREWELKRMIKRWLHC